MRSLELTMMQRLGLDSLLNAQRGKLEELTAFHDIRNKIKIPRALRDTFAKPMPGGQVMLDEAAIELAESITVELENEEVRRLRKLLSEWPNFGEGDLEWVMPVQSQLESITAKPRLMPKED